MAVSPYAKLKVDPVGHRLRADEPQHLEVAIAFFVRQIDGAHVVSRHREQERVGKQEIRVAHIVEEVVADAQVQT